MTIPGRGDLAPPRRQSSIGRWLTIVIVVGLLGGGGYAAYAGLRGASSGNAAPRPRLAVCPTPSTTTMFAAPRDVRLTIRNASLQTGLAATIRSELHHRGFHVSSIGNAVRVVHGVAAVRYSPDELRASRTLAAQIPGTITPTAITGRHVLDLELGLAFQQLRSAAAAHALERQRAAAASPSPTPTPTPTPTGTCRPRQ